MKIFSWYLGVTVFAVSLFSIGTAFAVNKVYPFDNKYGILADDSEWICKVSTLPGGTITSNIEGKARYLPISFDFSIRPIHWFDNNGKPSAASTLASVKLFLSNYALKNSAIFSNIIIKELEYNCFNVTGSYFDNTSIGLFNFYLIPRSKTDKTCYSMFVKISGNLLDDQTTEHLFQETINLITPLIL